MPTSNFRCKSSRRDCPTSLRGEENCPGDCPGNMVEEMSYMHSMPHAPVIRLQHMAQCINSF